MEYRQNPNCICNNIACERHGICALCRPYHEKAGGQSFCQRPADERPPAGTPHVEPQLLPFEVPGGPSLYIQLKKGLRRYDETVEAKVADGSIPVTFWFAELVDSGVIPLTDIVRQKLMEYRSFAENNKEEFK